MRKLHLLAPVVAAAIAACGNAAAGTTTATCRADVMSAPAQRCGLVLNEIAAAGAPDDWFELVNTSAAPIDLSDFVFVDTAGALDRARGFPAFVLAPGERHVQYVSAAVDGFQLAGDEALWIYRTDDRTAVDHADWREGESPAHGSYARNPDASGPFVQVTRDTQGAPNT